jgi:hypothetical protein
MNHAVEMASCGMINLRSFMKIGTGIQAILRFYFRNLKDCNVGITAGRCLYSTPLKWPQMG